MLISESDFSRCIYTADQKSGCMFDRTVGKWSLTLEGRYKYGLIITVTYESGEWKDWVIHSPITFRKLSNIITNLQERIIQDTRKGAS